MNLKRKIGAGTEVETMCGATLRGAKRSGQGGAWAQYIASGPEGAQRRVKEGRFVFEGSLP